MTPLNTSTEPIDRSKPAATITKVMPTAIVSNTAELEMSSWTLSQCGNVSGARKENTTKMTTSAANMYAGDELSPRRSARAPGDIPLSATASSGRPMSPPSARSLTTPSSGPSLGVVTFHSDGAFAAVVPTPSFFSN